MTKEVREMETESEGKTMSVPRICRETEDDSQEEPSTTTNKLLQRRLLLPDASEAPRHIRASSFKYRPRPKFLNVEIERPRRCSLPSPSRNLLSVSFDDIRHNTNVEREPLRRVRSFKTTSKGIVNRGDSFKRSSTSINSTGSAITQDSSVPAASGPSRQGSRARINSTNSRDSGTTASNVSEPVHHFYRVLMLGDKGTGKTSLTNQFMTSEYVAFEAENDENTGDRSVTVLLDSEESTLEFIDRQVSEKETRDRPLDAYVVVYSITDRVGYQTAVDTLYHLRHNCGTDRPVILIANKIDLVRKRKVAKDEGRSIASQYDCKYAETSAALNHHVDELLVGILSQIRLKLSPNIPVQPPRTVAHSHKAGKTKLTGTRKLLNKIFKRNNHKSSQECENLFSP